jgi:hypothetical protein
MGTIRPRSKFDFYFNAIGSALYYGCLFLGALFMIGYGLYQLFSGNFKWFKDHVLEDFAILLFIGIGIVIYRSWKGK